MRVAEQSSVESEIRAYYTENELEPIVGARIVFSSSDLVPETGLQAFMYWVTVGARRIPVSIEESAEGFKIDWSAFNQFRAATFEEFLADPKAEGGQFLVELRRSHYSGSDGGTGIEGFDVFQVASQIGPNKSAYAFSAKEAPAGSAGDAGYKWSTSYRTVVELEWGVPDNGGWPRIEIVRVVRDTWRRWSERRDRFFA